MYVDLLISLPESDPKYTDLVAENLPEGIRGESEIVAYCEGDFRSYSFHYNDARSVIQLNNNSGALFFTDDANDSEDAQTRYDHAEDIYNRSPVRLAMLDENGNILKISGNLWLQPREFMSYSIGYFRYDAETDELEVGSGGSGFGMILYGFISLTGLILTCLIEWIVAKLFKLTQDHGKVILWTNVVSQILMRVSHIGLYSVLFWKYSFAVIFLEIFVYAGEYLFYTWKMEDVSPKKRIAYVLTANTASLILGFYLNRFFLF